MPKKIQVEFTTFSDDKEIYNGLKSACEELGLNYNTVKMKFTRQAKDGFQRVHVWEGGKIEVNE